MKKVLFLLVLMLGCNSSPTVPTLPPKPTPQPTATPVQPTVKVSVFLAACCDDPATGGDEGFDRGWPLVSEDYLRWAQELSGGAIKGVVLRSGLYGDHCAGCGSYPKYGPNLESPDWTVLRGTVMMINSYGAQGVVDLVDGWPLRYRLGPLRNNCKVTDNYPPQFYLDHVEAVVNATKDLGVLYETGNELWLCDPSRQWEQGIVDVVRRLAPNRPVGSNARTGATVDYLTSHGWPPVFEPPEGSHWTETDQRILKVEDVELFVDLAAQGITTTIWPGETPTEDLQLVLQALKE